MGIGLAPGGEIAFIRRPIKQCARRQFGIEIGKGLDLAGRNAARNMLAVEIARMFKACGRRQFRQGMQGIVMEMGHAFGLVAHHQCALSAFILGCHACGAAVGMAGLRLDAANDKVIMN